MTRTAKLAAISTVALIAGIATMFLFPTFGPVSPFMSQQGFNGMSPMAGMWNGMGWMMLFGPLAMVSIFGGFVALIVLLITSLVRSSVKSQ
ncbi:hypothetical protein MIC97_24875 [Aquamicrobium sp. NLF2-7]|uniref:hypothetical protein n=1 Tax=Aquamicrobium sp. NLF2-7 TaxID=2918753 RepID=UPI001EFA8BB6|nr:hypothetical protein [Aquamicrobium sp. NLF2-7]MCG8274715.1 hypothetical protein [Aquamicrobium sp. NLF2-7]